MEKGKEINLTDEVLVNLPVKDSNSTLNSFSADEKNQIRRRCRMLKNRGHAKTCVKKRVRQRGDLEMETQRLRDELEQLTSELDNVKRERDEAREKYYSLQKVLTDKTKTVGLHCPSLSSAEHEIQEDVVGIDEDRENTKTTNPDE